MPFSHSYKPREIERLRTGVTDVMTWLPHTASKRLLRNRCGYAIPSFSDAYGERESGLGGSPAGKRPAVGAPLRRQPGLTPCALTPRAGLLGLLVCAEQPSRRGWMGRARCTHAHTTSRDARAGALSQVQRGSGRQRREPLGHRDERRAAGPEDAGRAGGAGGAPSRSCRTRTLEAEAA